MASLRIKHPDEKGELTHVLAGDRITIGRRPDNTIQIVDRTVSGHHAELIATNGHYRLHDLGSTNLTCVDGQPITDFHLHRSCKVSFGTVECEFTPAGGPSEEANASEVVPTRSELDYLRRENGDLQKTITALQKQIDILSSARLITKETTHVAVAPEEHRRIAAECQELRAQNDLLKNEVLTLKSDFIAITRDRDATRQAWETVKGELLAAQHALEALYPSATAGAAGSSAPTPTPAKPSPVAEPAKIAVPAPEASARKSTGPKGRVADSTRPPAAPPTDANGTPMMSPEAHRAMASVLSKAPGLLESLRKKLEQLGSEPAAASDRQELLSQSKALVECTTPIKGHPLERLAVSFDALLHEEKSLEAANLRTLNQGIELARALFDPKHLKRVKELSRPRVLLVDDDQDLLATLSSSLGTAEITTAKAGCPSEALALLQEKSFDLILLDIALPEQSGIELCARIREIPASGKTPIVFLTARDTVDNRAQSSLQGGNDFIAKPFNISELTLKAQTWMYRAQFALN